MTEPQPMGEVSIMDILRPDVVERVYGERAVLTFRPDATWTIGGGIVQGGIVTAMLDMAMAVAVDGLSTASITCDIMRPVTGPELTVTSSITKMGRRLLFAEAEMVNAEGKLVARATQTAVPLPTN